MKSIILATMALFAINNNAQATQPEFEKVSEAIYAFASAADNNNVTELKSVLDDNFRVVMNQLMGSDKVVVLNKETYLQMVSSGKLGGDKREVKINGIDINGNNAVANVVLKGSKFTINSYLLLVKDATGKWLIVNDLPSIG